MNVLDAILGAPRRAVQKGLSHIPGLEGIDAGGSEWLTRQGMRDSLLKSALSFGIDTATDPLTYIGAGTMKGALGFVKNTLPRAAERATGEAVMSGMLRSAEQGTEAAGKLGKVIDAADLFGKQASRSAKLEAETKALLEEAGHARPMRSNLGPFDPTEIPDAGPRLVKSAPTTTRSGRMYAAMPKARKDLEMVEQDLMANYGHPDYLYHSTTMDNANAIRKVGMNSGETSLYGNGAYFGKGSYDPRYFGGEAWGHDIVMGPNPLKNPFVINTVEENKQFLDGISAIEKSLMDRGIPYQDAYKQARQTVVDHLQSLGYDGIDINVANTANKGEIPWTNVFDPSTFTPMDDMPARLDMFAQQRGYSSFDELQNKAGRNVIADMLTRSHGVR